MPASGIYKFITTSNTNKPVNGISILIYAVINKFIYTCIIIFFFILWAQIES